MERTPLLAGGNVAPPAALKTDKLFIRGVGLACLVSGSAVICLLLALTSQAWMSADDQTIHIGLFGICSQFTKDANQAATCFRFSSSGSIRQRVGVTISDKALRAIKFGSSACFGSVFLAAVCWVSLTWGYLRGVERALTAGILLCGLTAIMCFITVVAVGSQTKPFTHGSAVSHAKLGWSAGLCLLSFFLLTGAAIALIVIKRRCGFDQEAQNSILSPATLRAYLLLIIQGCMGLFASVSSALPFDHNAILLPLLVMPLHRPESDVHWAAIGILGVSLIPDATALGLYFDTGSLMDRMSANLTIVCMVLKPFMAVLLIAHQRWALLNLEDTERAFISKKTSNSPSYTIGSPRKAVPSIKNSTRTSKARKQGTVMEAGHSTALQQAPRPTPKAPTTAPAPPASKNSAPVKSKRKPRKPPVTLKPIQEATIKESPEPDSDTATPVASPTEPVPSTTQGSPPHAAAKAIAQKPAPSKTAPSNATPPTVVPPKQEPAPSASSKAPDLPGASPDVDGVFSSSPSKGSKAKAKKAARAARKEAREREQAEQARLEAEQLAREREEHAAEVQRIAEQARRRDIMIRQQEEAVLKAARQNESARPRSYSAGDADAPSEGSLKDAKPEKKSSKSKKKKKRKVSEKSLSSSTTSLDKDVGASVVGLSRSRSGSTSSLTDLRHTSGVSDNDDDGFTCPVCGEVFADMIITQMHMRSHKRRTKTRQQTPDK